jgi:DNA mismatch endonuclease (patch repair protein)
MTDIYSKNKRSEIMSHISNRETKQEIIVRKFLFSKGFRYRKNVKTLSGKPDIVLPKYKTIIFIHGCFWHGHKCKRGKLPENNRNFWLTKIRGNAKRDKQNVIKLKKLGWKVITIWQCEINNLISREKRLNEVLCYLMGERGK